MKKKMTSYFVDWLGVLLRIAQYSVLTFSGPPAAGIPKLQNQTIKNLKNQKANLNHQWTNKYVLSVL